MVDCEHLKPMEAILDNEKIKVTLFTLALLALVVFVLYAANACEVLP